MATLESGSTGVKAEVDGNKRLQAQVVDETSDLAHTRLGYGFNINTGDITVSNATKLTIIYVKNTGDNPLVFTAAIYLTGNSTNGTAATDFLWTAIKNPTAGDIITNTNDCESISNRLFVSENTLQGVAYKGAVGETAVSGGSTFFSTRLASSGRTAIPIWFVLPKGQSVAVDFTAKTSNTNCIVQCALPCFEQRLT